MLTRIYYKEKDGSLAHRDVEGLYADPAKDLADVGLSRLREQLGASATSPVMAIVGEL